MKMSSKARYGLYVSVELARRYNNQEIVTVSSLAQATGVTEKYLEQIIALMKKAQIVVSSRGANGGYKLTDEPSNISVGRILRAVEDNLQIVDCIHKDCAIGCNCVSRNLWTKLQININSYLDTISLQQLLEDNL